MTELTSKSRNGVIVFVVLLTCLMFGFHYDNIVRGLFPDYSFEPNDSYKQCHPVGFKEYLGSYHDLR